MGNLMIGIVGRPNVGKSTLFNRFSKSRRAVVANESGTTRDRIVAEVEWHGHGLSMVDMAGIEVSLKQADALTKAVQDGVLDTIGRMDAFLWLVDGRREVDSVDRAIAQLLRRKGKRVIIAVNFADDQRSQILQHEYAEFGFEGPFLISALHKKGLIELLNTLTSLLPEVVEQPEVVPDERELRIALAGRPNVGKSTLLNSLIGERRAVVSDVPGTTRDAVDEVVPAHQVFGKVFTKWRQVRFIDTAGIRRRGKIGHEVEAWSVLRTYDAIDAAEIVLFLVDVHEGLTHQDLVVADRVVKAGKSLLFILNKWDIELDKFGFLPGSDEDQVLQEKVLTKIRNTAPFLFWAPVIFISAETGLNVEALGKRLVSVHQAWSRIIVADHLEALAIELSQFPRLKNLITIEQVGSQPPHFRAVFEGSADAHFSSIRQIENAIRETFDLVSTPIQLETKGAKRGRRQSYEDYGSSQKSAVYSDD
jgi:GTP-binding protein